MTPIRPDEGCSSRPDRHGLASGFLKSVEAFPERPALVVDNETYSYRQLFDISNRIAGCIDAFANGAPGLTAVLAQRSATAYAGTLAALIAGTGYVPLNPRFPVARLRAMLSSSGSRILVVGSEAAFHLPELLTAPTPDLLVIAPHLAGLDELRSAWPRHVFMDGTATAHGIRHPAAPSRIAYLLFTSGSTGEPKGVPIAHENVRPYLDYVCERYEITEQDRFSQMFDATFDLSVHDMFVCWERGACLHTVPERSVMAPAKFIREHELTMWFSVPSVAALMSRMRLLTAGTFPSLRYSLFCGEPLPAVLAEAWQIAAPNSTVENLYGPTEATIAISHYRWQQDVSPAQSTNGIVPIGWPFAGQKAQVFDADGRPTPRSQTGELWLAGSQVTDAYWENPQRTKAQFVRAADGSGPWYRTGDLARLDAMACLHYAGRLDQQVKVRGHRVELQEVEAVLRSVTGAAEVAAVAWPVHHGSADGIIAFVTGIGMPDVDTCLNACRLRLPEYMVPRAVHFLPEFPLNANGKIDRAQLISLLTHSGAKLNS